ncbi:MAG: Malonyl CoA-acyl carrier protein transacylase [Firmicutes bacterium]|nr:Malonyl CoA-acyl carrier protein transacylase [candidate division NPL-UPA2 bacterium]MBT9153699.1 Malonyl CoA-acyl carrier protein transacylase [candidate division NPL-UPA2 bacterium]
MERLVFLFPGQGSQYVGMGMEMAAEFSEAAEVFAEANSALNSPLSDVIWGGPAEQLAQTEITQPAILTMSVAVLRVLAKHGIAPAATAGLSLGEYTALVAAGALCFDKAVCLVRERGRLMQAAVPAGRGAVAAVMGLDSAVVEQACLASREVGVVAIANYNCPGQVVIAGEVPAVDAALGKCTELGAKRAVKLPVSAPFHTSLLGSAGEALRLHLERASISPLRLPVVSNVTANYHTDVSLVDSLVAQVSSPVRFEESVRRLLADGYKHFVEVGPGNTLASFVKRIDKDVNVFSVGDRAGLVKLLGCLA